MTADETPISRDALFGDDQKAAPAPPASPGGSAAGSGSRDALFGNDLGAPPRSPWRGYMLGELADTYASPSHWSKMLVRSELDAEGVWAAASSTSSARGSITTSSTTRRISTRRT